MPGRHASHATKYRARCGNAVQVKEIEQRLRLEVDGGIDPIGTLREFERRSVPSIAHRANRESIYREKCLVTAFAYGHGERTGDARWRGGAVTRERRDPSRRGASLSGDRGQVAIEKARIPDAERDVDGARGFGKV